MRRQYKQSGFALIGLIIVVAIIVIMFALYENRGGQNSTKTTVDTGRQAEQNLNDSNKQLQDYQNQLNGQ